MTTNKAQSNRLLRIASGALLVAALLSTVLTSSGFARDKKHETQLTAPKIDTSKLEWPAPPDVPRIKWLQAVSGEEDVTGVVAQKKKTSWMDRLAGVTLPAERGKPRLRKPYGIAADSKGLIYVADAALPGIFVFDLENKKIQYRGTQELVAPIGLVMDDTDRLFVSDSATHMITVYKADGSVEGTFGQDKLVHPTGLAIDNENRFLYVVDTEADRLAIFDADTYKFLRYMGKKSDENAAPGTFDSPTNAAVDRDGNVYVVDTFNDRIQVFNADGEFVSMFGKEGNYAGTFMRPKGIAIDHDNHVYVVDAEFNNVQVFDTNGNTLMFFGDRGYTPGAFLLAAGICVDSKNRVLVDDQWTGRLQIFRYVTDEEAKPEYEKAAAEAKKQAAEEAAREKAAGRSTTVLTSTSGSKTETKDSAPAKN
jgi:sugar lactone lactonase YvrE